MSPIQFDRRRLLAGGIGALGAAALGACSRREAHAASAEPILVLLQLYGGVDGLTTVVPFRDDAYYRARPTIALAEKDLLRVDEDHGLHPSLRELRANFDEGRVAIVEGCGYPEPFYSHFRSMDVWHTGFHEGKVAGEGWIGRLREAAWADRASDELVVHVGSELPWSLACASRPPLVFGSAGNFQSLGDDREQRTLRYAVRASRDAAPPTTPAPPATPSERALEALRASFEAASRASERVLAAVEHYQPSVEYPNEALAESFRTIAAMIDAGFETRVYSLAHGNYDSHGNVQVGLYKQLHRRLDACLGAFLADVRRTTRGRDVVVLAFSEFGRRFHENESNGTDHGAAGPVFLLGERVRGGFHGRPPSLVEVDADDNLVFTTDFRRVYASVLEQCFGVANERVLGTRWEPLPLIA
ncbi:MAG: DUF1501 domain-containing protein [Planctomycetes bacterium]|nr:DUF1501 domain-containing protein [Planctomycetota bacterium]